MRTKELPPRDESSLSRQEMENPPFDIRFINEDALDTDRQFIISSLRSAYRLINTGLVNDETYRIWILGLQSKRFILEIALEPEKLIVAYSEQITYEAGYNEEKSLEIFAYLVTEDGKRHPYMPHFRELFAITLEHFEKLGKPIQSVTDGWYRSKSGMTNKNWDVYRQYITEGMKPERAALMTPAGKVYKSHNYTDVHFSCDPLDESGVDMIFYKAK